MTKLKSEIDNNLLIYNSKDFRQVSLVGSSDGCLPKYTNEKVWIKVDTIGYRSLAEVLVSRAAEALGFSCVKYSPCYFVIEDIAHSACISDSYLQPHKSETTLGRELCKLSDIENLDQLMHAINKLPSVSERLDYVFSLIEPLVDLNRFKRYLADLLWLDSVVFNTDRHLHNIVFLIDDEQFLPTPYFDFGDSLLSDTFKFPMEMTAAYGIYKVKSKPFSSSFKKQVAAIEKYRSKTLYNSIGISVSDLYEYYDKPSIDRALAVLRLGLAQYDINLNTYQASDKITNFFTQ